MCGKRRNKHNTQESPPATKTNKQSSKPKTFLRVAQLASQISVCGFVGSRRWRTPPSPRRVPAAVRVRTRRKEKARGVGGGRQQRRRHDGRPMRHAHGCATKHADVQRKAGPRLMETAPTHYYRRQTAYVARRGALVVPAAVCRSVFDLTFALFSATPSTAICNTEKRGFLHRRQRSPAPVVPSADASSSALPALLGGLFRGLKV